MNKKKYVALSTKSLEKVWNWCEANEQHYLAIDYMLLCFALGEFIGDGNEFVTGVFVGEPKVKPSRANRLYDIRQEVSDCLYQSRDEIGRMILSDMKKVKKND